MWPAGLLLPYLPACGVATPEYVARAWVKAVSYGVFTFHASELAHTPPVILAAGAMHEEPVGRPRSASYV